MNVTINSSFSFTCCPVCEDDNLPGPTPFKPTLEGMCRCRCHRAPPQQPVRIIYRECAIVGCQRERQIGIAVYPLSCLCVEHEAEFVTAPEGRGAPNVRPTAIADFRDRLWKVRCAEIEAAKRLKALAS